MGQESRLIQYVGNFDDFSIERILKEEPRISDKSFCYELEVHAKRLKKASEREMSSEHVSNLFTSGKVPALLLKVTSLLLEAENEIALGRIIQDPAKGREPEKVKNVVLNGNYIYVAEKNVSTPTVGDMRISYSAVTSPVTVTLLGRLNGNKITAMTDAKTGVTLYRAFNGTFEDALGTLHKEYKTALWIFRVIGFLMMWIGLAMVLAPLSVLLDVLPIFGTISRSVVGLVTFLVALVLSIVTIVVSMVLHNPLVLILVIIAVGIYVFKLVKKAKQNTNLNTSLHKS